jgi:hypothetical protein
MARAARPCNGAVCLTLNARGSGLVRLVVPPSIWTARPRKLCLVSVAISDPTNGADRPNETAADGEGDFAIW